MRDLDGQPWRLLQDWLPSNDDPVRPWMTLSTVTADGHADARTVLLTEFGPEGLYFHTDARSRKVAQLQTNPAVALTVVWPGFTQQLVVAGAAEVAPSGEVAAAYRARSPYLQQLAWQNSASFAQLPTDERRKDWAAFTAGHPDGFEQPPNWTGYLVRPWRLTFWQGDATTASLRSEFTATDHGWSVSLLPG